MIGRTRQKQTGSAKLTQTKSSRLKGSASAPRSFEAENISSNQHVQSNILITPEARQMQLALLRNEAVRQLRIFSLNHDFVEHKKDRESGRAPKKDNARTMVLNGLKRQELETLQAFSTGKVKEERALYKLLEVQFLWKMISGPAFSTARLRNLDLAAIETLRFRCLQAFHRKNPSPG